MGYLHIENLYRNQDILLFKEAYALEKIHGTSAHVSFKAVPDQQATVGFFSGEQYDRFVQLFDKQVLLEKFLTLGISISLPRTKNKFQKKVDIRECWK